MRLLNAAVLLGGMLVCLPVQAVEMSIPDALGRQIAKCWVNPGPTQSYKATMNFKVDKHGAVVGSPEPETEPERPSAKAFVDAARRAILRCAPYPLAAGEDMRVHF